MRSIWFTSDTHFNHSNSIKFTNRPFADVKDMNESLIANWNTLVKQSDTIYHLGDFGFGNNESLKKIRYSLNGKICLILGNHDYKNKLERCTSWFTSIEPLKVINVNKISITLCHFAMRVWHKSHYNAPMLYGHSHGKLEGAGKSFDVGVDSWNYRPVNIEEIFKKLETCPDNFNLVRNRI